MTSMVPPLNSPGLQIMQRVFTMVMWLVEENLIRLAHGQNPRCKKLTK
jgi:hypothetical protein